MVVSRLEKLFKIWILEVALSSVVTSHTTWLFILVASVSYLLEVWMV